MNVAAIIFASFLALALAKPQSYEPAASEASLRSGQPIVQILRDDRIHPEGGSYSFDVETEDGIVRSESGSALTHLEEAPTGQQGSFSYPLPNGETFTLKFVANENGYQPESPFLPVAPEFPHPIPQFVLDQIAFAAQQRDSEARSGSASSPSGTYA